MVEAVANGVEDKLIDGLSFKLAPGASYVQDRRSVTFHPAGGNIYKPGQGSPMIKFVLSGDQWLDPSTFRVAFDLVNLEEVTGKQLRPLGGPHTFFRRLRVLCGGQILEDIDLYNRVHELFDTLKSKHSRTNEAVEGFGMLFDETQFEKWTTRLNGPDPSILGAFQGTYYADPGTGRLLTRAADIAGMVNYPGYCADDFRGIPARQSQRVLFKPLSGILSQSKFLPIRYMPLTIELELVNTMAEPIFSDFGLIGCNINSTNTSVIWQIENPEIKVDMISLDNALDNTYARHLLEGKSLPINYNTFVSQIQSITGPKPSVNVARALTRLKSIFVTLDKDTGAGYNLARPGLKSWNRFWSPMSPNNDADADPNVEYPVFDSRGEFKFSVQIGSKIYPEYPIRSHSEAFSQLKKTLGIQSSNVHSFDISAKEYRDYKMILATDCEKVLDAGWTGLNTRAGDLMRVTFEYNTAEAARLADRMHIVLHSDQIVEIRDTGVQIFD
jgi:hypothetical protein